MTCECFATSPKICPLMNCCFTENHNNIQTLEIEMFKVYKVSESETMFSEWLIRQENILKFSQFRTVLIQLGILDQSSEILFSHSLNKQAQWKISRLECLNGNLPLCKKCPYWELF